MATLDVETTFRARGLRVTPQRSLVFRLLREMGEEHPSAEAVYVRASRQMPTLSLRTVYAILKELESLGLLRSLDLGTGSMRFCVNARSHHHVVCTRCGRVKDVIADLGPVEIPPEQRRGFTITGQDVVFRGLCAECRA